MKIAVVASLSAIATANYLVRALRRAGHNLVVVSDLPSPEADVIAQGAPDLAGICARRSFVPELVLFIEGGSMRLFPRGLERFECPTAWYGIDTHTDYPRHLRLARLFDMTFVAQKMFLPRLVGDGIRATQWLPLAFPSELFPDSEQPRPIDLAFVGSLDASRHPERSRLFEVARTAVARADISAATPTEMMQRYAAAKIVLNRSLNNDINMRYFEAMGAGAVLLTDPAMENGAEELFEVGRHYLVYRSEHELLAGIRSVLDFPEQARQIGTAARKLVEAKHTYDHRVAVLMNAVRDIGKRMRPEPADYFAVLTSLNIAGGALAAASEAVARMGHGSRWHSVNRMAGWAIQGMAVIRNAAFRIAGWLRK